MTVDRWLARMDTELTNRPSVDTNQATVEGHIPVVPDLKRKQSENIYYLVWRP